MCVGRRKRGGAWFIVGYLSELDTFRLLGIGSVDSEAVIFNLRGVLEPFFCSSCTLGLKLNFMSGPSSILRERILPSKPSDAQESAAAVCLVIYNFKLLV